MINRKILEQMEEYLAHPDKKIIFLWGARQTGKSTILKKLYEEFGGVFLNFDDLETVKLFTPELTALKSLIRLNSGTKKSPYIFIDEIQKNPDSTRAVKLLTDNTDFCVVATGSSELRAKSSNFDTLAGRFKEFILFPLTLDELAVFTGNSTEFTDFPDRAQSSLLSHLLEEMMIYGSYPYVSLTREKIEELKNISQTSIIKDIVNIYNLKDTGLIYHLLQLLALQTGNLVNFTELSKALNISRPTVLNYLSILEKNRIIYFLKPFKTNARKAIIERPKVYFLDLGIRNSLIDDFRETGLRPDRGAVFENLVIAGIYRQNIYRRNNNSLYYYREHGGKELDLIVKTPAGEFSGFEIKYQRGEINRFDDIPITVYKLISKENCMEYLV